ncbi:MAG: hypothetical protein ACI9QV_001474 [Methylophagaceae bacterium]|jgi:hypothetical protein
MTRYLISCFTFLVSSALFAQELPDFSANYLIQLNGIQAGELKRSLVSQANGSRLFKSETQAKGVFAFFKPEKIVETSLWKGSSDNIVPQEYRYTRTGGKKDKYMALEFDWVTQQLSIDDKKQPWSLDLEQGTLDKLVYQLALMSDLAKEQHQFNYRIADGGKIKQYKITEISHEVVSTPLGYIDTIKLTRERNSSKHRETTLWCAPKLGYLPVKLQHTEKNGAVFTAVLRRLSGIDTDLAFTDTVSEVLISD